MITRLRSEVGFVVHLVKLNLAGLMEYRATFLTQAVGMFINNGIYFVFWLMFFDRFEDVRGYQIEQIFLLFALVAGGWGLAFTFAGNANRIAGLIAQGRLDYYLTLPRPVLPHLLFSYMNPFTMGDLTFAVMAYLFAGRFDVLSILLWLACSICTAIICVSFMAVVSCAAFFLGNAAQWTFYFENALVTFSLYPNGLFQGAIRLILFTLIPSAFIGAVPVEIVETHSFTLLGILASVALVGIVILNVVFRVGLRRYESGSAINVNI
jgi:ABC-2 type transport system permease protein